MRFVVVEFVTSTATGTKADPTTAPPSHFTPTVSSKSLTTNVTDTEVAAASAAPNTREFDVASTVKTSISTSQTVYIEYASSSTVAFSPGVSNATPIIDETHLPSIVSSLKTMPDRTTAPTDFKSVVSTTSIVSSTETTHDPSDPTEFTYMSTLSIVPSTATELTPDPTTDYKPVVSSPSIFSSTETTHDPSSTPTAFTSMSTMSIVPSTELTPDPTTDYKPVLSSPSIFSSTETTHDPSTAPTEFTSVVSLPSIVQSTETTADPTTAPSFHFTSAVASQATTSNTDRATPSEQSTIIKTEKSASTSTTAPDLNTCDKCCIKVNSTLTEHEIEMKQNLLKVQLAVNKTNLSSHRRKLISVYDSRPSSLAMGIVACAILVSVGVFIIIMDAITMYRLMYKRFMNRV
ncbi:mucin-2-like [Pecten maximus]|uniref:mucin-2-like n=1 Tax=Pecten maximus TaxID=6579 RepID=UPI00145842E4|nr:mucin-2-like [Pecten maximus]